MHEQNCRDVMNIYPVLYVFHDAQATVGERTNNFILESDFHTFFSAWTLEQLFM